MQQLGIRHEIKQMIESGVAEDQLDKIVVTASNRDSLEWEHEKEFRYNGAMFDVVRYSVHNDTIVYYCVADKNETLLFAKLDEMTWNRIKAGEKGNQLKNIFRLLANLHSVPVNISWSGHPQAFIFSTPAGSSYSSNLADPSIPPPKLV